MKYPFKVTTLMTTPESQISDCSKVCYQTTHDRDITKQLVKSGHLAVLRFAYVTFNVSDISVPCHTQMLRSKHLDFLVQSKRYVNPTKQGFKAITPIGYDESVTSLFKEAYEQSIAYYNVLIDSGVKKEDARAVLPMNTATELNVTGNLQAWSDHIKLRVSKHAQREIREVAITIWGKLAELYPNVFPAELLINGKTLKVWRDNA